MSLINWHIPTAAFKKRCTKRDFFNLVIDWACFSLASFSLQRVWCRALISGSRTAPCVSGKNDRMTVPFTLTVSRFDQLLAYLLDFGPYSFVSLSQPVRTAPCVSGKNDRMTVPFTLTVSRFDQLLAYLLDFGPYSFVSLSQPVRTAPCVSGKNDRMTVPFTLTVSRFDQLLAYLLDFGPYSFVSLSQPVR